jgi:hypothetical protein
MALPGNLEAVMIQTRRPEVFMSKKLYAFCLLSIAFTIHLPDCIIGDTEVSPPSSFIEDRGWNRALSVGISRGQGLEGRFSTGQGCKPEIQE